MPYSPKLTSFPRFAWPRLRPRCSLRCLTLFGISMTATRWWLLLRASNLPQTLIRAFRLTFIGCFFNNVVPGQTGGDLVRAYYIARENKGRKTDSILTVIVDLLWR